MTIRRSYVYMLAIGLILGVLTISQRRITTAPPMQRAQELSSTVLKLQQENHQLLTKVSELSEQLHRYELSLDDVDMMTQQVKNSLQMARMEAGVVPLQGAGLRVDIGNLVIPATGQVVKYVEDEDLLTIINELYAAGAEAIAINGERIISTSEIRLAGNFININTRPQAAPFVIFAIGNPETLSAALHLYGGVIDTFSQIAKIQAQKLDHIDIPAYRGTMVYQWASPSKE